MTRSISILSKNATTVITAFTAENSINELSEDWSWSCDNDVSSSVPFNMSANEELLVVMEHSYSLSNRSVNCLVNSTDGNQSITLPLSYDGLVLEHYNSTVTDSDSVDISFTVRNDFSSQDVSWNITTGGQVYESSSPTTLQQSERMAVSQGINFTRSGLKRIDLIVAGNNFTLSHTEYVVVDWLTLNEFYNTVKNATARVMDFFVTNENQANTSAVWNTTEPILGDNTTLAHNESILVVIEEDYSQGQKQHTVKLYNSTNLEDSLTDIFTIKHIEIEEFSTLHQEDKRVVTSSVIRNNVENASLSWQLNNSQDLISSTLALNLTTGEEVIVVVDSYYEDSGVYPLNFKINSSDLNDNATGVTVS